MNIFAVFLALIIIFNVVVSAWVSFLIYHWLKMDLVSLIGGGVVFTVLMMVGSVIILEKL